jgi:hypothetical protein
MSARGDAHDAAVEIVVVAKLTAPFFEQVGKSPADVPETDQRQISAHQRRSGIDAGTS